MQWHNVCPQYHYSDSSMSKVCRVGAIKAVAASAGLANLVVHAPPLPVQFGTYHSKAFMIEYESGVRVVVHTANLIYVDCNNKSQGLWFQDFPRKVGLPCC